MKNICGLIAITFLLSMSACKKYDEGPALSLKSKKERVANVWKIDRAYNGDKDISTDFNQYELVFTKGGTSSLTATYVFVGTTYTVQTNGTWSFVSDKEKIEVDYENDDADAVYLILKLKEKELWVRKEGTDLELHLIPR